MFTVPCLRRVAILFAVCAAALSNGCASVADQRHAQLDRQLTAFAQQEATLQSQLDGLVAYTKKTPEQRTESQLRKRQVAGVLQKAYENLIAQVVFAKGLALIADLPPTPDEELITDLAQRFAELQKEADVLHGQRTRFDALPEG